MGEVFDLIAVDGGLAVNQYRQNTLVFTNPLGRVASISDKCGPNQEGRPRCPVWVLFVQVDYLQVVCHSTSILACQFRWRAQSHVSIMNQ